jgi:hypothetical protein
MELEWTKYWDNVDLELYALIIEKLKEKNVNNGNSK